MKRKSNVTTSSQIKSSESANLKGQGWLNPTKCTLRWLGLRPTRLNNGEKTYSLKMDDQAA